MWVVVVVRVVVVRLVAVPLVDVRPVVFAVVCEAVGCAVRCTSAVRVVVVVRDATVVVRVASTRVRVANAACVSQPTVRHSQRPPTALQAGAV